MDASANSMRLKFPELGGNTDPALEFALEEARRMVDNTWVAKDQVLALMYLAAHYLAVIAMTAESGTSQIVESETIGRLSQRFATVKTPPDATELQTTIYGRRFLDILNRNWSGGFVV